MKDLDVMDRAGGRRTVPGSAVEALRLGMRGQLLFPKDPGYDEARTLWDGRTDHRPAFVARCVGVADVRAAVGFATAHRLALSVHAGGLGPGGASVSDGGVMIDLSPMRSVLVDPAACVAHVEGGARTGDVDHETLAFGLVTPLGVHPDVGVAGLALDGGFGWLSRLHGTTADNVVGVDLVTAQGELVHASADENPELFWALRGGGAPLGVVTRLVLRLHPMPREVLTGTFVYPLDQAHVALRRFREVAVGLPDETTVWALLRKAPALPFLDRSTHGTDVVLLMALHVGAEEAGRRAFEPLRQLGNLMAERIEARRYGAWQHRLDPMLGEGSRHAWHTRYFEDLHDPVLDLLVQQTRRLPTKDCEVLVSTLGGRVASLDPGSTAYPGRDLPFAVTVHGRWEKASQDEDVRGWTGEVLRGIEPFGAGAAYGSRRTAEETERARAAATDRSERLLRVRQQWDPDGVFTTRGVGAPGGPPELEPA